MARVLALAKPYQREVAVLVSVCLVYGSFTAAVRPLSIQHSCCNKGEP